MRRWLSHLIVALAIMLISHVITSFVFGEILKGYEQLGWMEAPKGRRVFINGPIPPLFWPLLLPLWCLWAVAALVLTNEAPWEIVLAVWLAYFMPLIGLYVVMAYVWRWLTHRPISPGCCLQCGYDLRASKDKCPECGTAIPPGFSSTLTQLPSHSVKPLTGESYDSTS